MPCACSILADEISVINVTAFWTDSVIVCIAEKTFSVTSAPLLTFICDCFSSSAVSFAARPLRCAKLRTSSATTAKPLPASPARAASTAALSANKFVWNATSSMVLIIFAVSSDDFLIADIA